jgi:hypothetical protein
VVADYEAAWVELGELIQSREGWGSKTLAAEMAAVLARHRVSEGTIERILRLHGGQIAVVMSTPEAPASDVRGTTPRAVEPVPGHSKTEEVTDGSRNSRVAVG